MPLAQALEPSVWTGLIVNSPIAAALLLSVWLFLARQKTQDDGCAATLKIIVENHAESMKAMADQLERIADRLDRMHEAPRKVA